MVMGVIGIGKERIENFGQTGLPEKNCKNENVTKMDEIATKKKLAGS